MIVLYVALAVAALALLYGLVSIKVIKEYERGVVFLLGKIRGERGPGLVFVPAIVERMVRVNLQVTTIDIPSQELITSDSVTVRVTAVAWFHVVEPIRATVRVRDYLFAVEEFARATLLSALREVPLDSLLRQREEIQLRLTEMMDATTEPWGLKVTLVEVKDVELPESVRRSMAKEAEAERERRAKIVNAKGELEAAADLSKAAGLLDVHPSALRLRELATLVEIASEKNSTIIFPLPVELMKLAAELEHHLSLADEAQTPNGRLDPQGSVQASPTSCWISPPLRSEPVMSVYKALAVDFDGTLTDTSRVSTAVICALRDARWWGSMLLLVTGRILDEPEAVFPTCHDVFDAIVAENGAVLAKGPDVRVLAVPVSGAQFDGIRARSVDACGGRVLIASCCR